MEIPFGGHVDEAIIARAVRLHMKPKRVASIGLLVIFAVMAWGAIGVPLTLGRKFDPVAPAMLAGLAVFFALLRVATIKGSQRTFRTSKILQQPLTGVATPERIRIQGPYGSSDHPWEVLVRAKASVDMVLLYPSRQQFHAIPREFVATPEQWQTIVGWATQSVVTPPARLLWNWWAVLLWLVMMILVYVAWSSG